VCALKKSNEADVRLSIWLLGKYLEGTNNFKTMLTNTQQSVMVIQAFYLLGRNRKWRLVTSTRHEQKLLGV